MSWTKLKKYKGKTGQEIQDEVFRKMSADKKLELASGLWKLGKELKGKDYISYLYSRHDVQRK